MSRVIILFGAVGQGKSSLLNALIGKENRFKTGDSITPETKETTYDEFNYVENSKKIKITVIDTPGFLDQIGENKIENEKYFKEMLSKIKSMNRIDLFIMCIDGNNTRFTKNNANVIEQFNQIFPGFLEHTALVFTKWTSPDLNVLKQVKKEYENFFKKIDRQPNMECFFIDCFFNLKKLRFNDDGSKSFKFLHPIIQERTLSQLNQLKKYLVSKKTFYDLQNICF